MTESKRGEATFRHQLLKLIPKESLKPNQVSIFNVHASYGRYQIILHPKNELEINGQLHHLFVSEAGVSPNPSQAQIHNNLRGTVIMRDLDLHLKDPSGDGHHLESAEPPVQARESINLAGDLGTSLVEQIKRTGKLARATYKIVQEDILKTLTRQREAH